MPIFMNDFFIQVHVTNPNEQLMLFGLIGAAALCLFLRVILAIGYQSQNTIVSMTAKEMKDKSDVDKLRIGPFARAAKEYILLGDRGVTRIDTRAIVEKNLLKMRFLLWNFKSVQTFVTMLEAAVLPFGILFAFFAAEAGRSVFLVCIAAVFGAIRIFASLLDFDVAKESFVTNTVYLLDREIGRFYTNDTAASLTLLREELKTAMTAQGDVLAAVITKMGMEFSDKITASLADMSTSFAQTGDELAKGTATLLADVSAYTTTLSGPLAEWKNGVQAAGEAQTSLNTALVSVNTAINNFAAIIGGMGTTLGDYRAELLDNSRAVETQITKLSELLSAVRENNSAFAIRGDAVEAQLATVKSHQSVLEKSVQQYETTLREVTSQLGEAMGKMVNFHLHQSYGALTDGVKENLDKIMAGNGDLLKRLQELFERMQEQSRSETAAIVSMKEQMDLHFAELKKTE